MPKQGDNRHLVKRGGRWRYMRRVPRRYRDVYPHTFHRVATGTSDIEAARRFRDRTDAAIEALWAALLKQESGDPHAEYEAAVERARLEGVTYLTARAIGMRPLEELVARLEKLQAAGVEDSGAAAALLGARDAPELRLSATFARFDELTEDRQLRYSPDQRRKFRAQHKSAMANLIAAAGGDKALRQLNRDDALALRAHWVKRVAAGEVTPATANKNIGQARKVVDTVSGKLELGLPDLFAKLTLDEPKKKKTRPPFETAWIRNRILAPGALEQDDPALDPEARGIVLLLVETGLRPVEACCLHPEDILVFHNIPHVCVCDVDDLGNRRARALKTEHSERRIPLIGVSLEAMRQFPQGFPAWYDRNTQLSDHVNHYLRAHGLLPTPRHTLYSLRHSFQDRLTAIDTPPRMDHELMGHKYDRELYGAGPSLEHKRDHLLKIAVSC